MTTTLLGIAMLCLAVSLFCMYATCRKLRQLIQMNDQHHQGRVDYLVSRVHRLEKRLKP